MSIYLDYQILICDDDANKIWVGATRQDGKTVTWWGRMIWEVLPNGTHLSGSLQGGLPVKGRLHDLRQSKLRKGYRAIESLGFGSAEFCPLSKRVSARFEQEVTESVETGPELSVPSIPQAFWVQWKVQPDPVHIQQILEDVHQRLAAEMPEIANDFKQLKLHQAIEMGDLSGCTYEDGILGILSLYTIGKYLDLQIADDDGVVLPADFASLSPQLRAVAPGLTDREVREIAECMGAVTPKMHLSALQTSVIPAFF